MQNRGITHCEYRVFLFKPYNQNHRLSRWYAPRLQGDITGNPTRVLKKFANCNFFTGRR